MKATQHPTQPPARHLQPDPPQPSTRTEELRSFLFFTIVMAPALAVIIVGGYGFLVWMYQLVAGPPVA
jgi:periplasmic nitrate reductase NapE